MYNHCAVQGFRAGQADRHIAAAASQTADLQDSVHHGWPAASSGMWWLRITYLNKLLVALLIVSWFLSSRDLFYILSCFFFTFLMSFEAYL